MREQNRNRSTSKGSQHASLPTGEQSNVRGHAECRRWRNDMEQSTGDGRMLRRRAQEMEECYGGECRRWRNAMEEKLTEDAEGQS